MKSLQLEGERLLKLRDVECPEAKDSEEVVLVQAAGIGGSEYLGFNNPGIRPLPNAMGHGFAGITSNQDRVAVYPLSGCGQCHYCEANQSQLCDHWALIGVQSDGGFAQRVSVPRDQIVRIPDDLSWENSVFIEPFANSINAWELSGADDAETIAVIGCGSLGLGLVACAHRANNRFIDIAEPSETRREAALFLGANAAQPNLDREYDVVFDTVGSASTRQQGIQATRKGGKCVFLGFETPETAINMSEMIRGQKTLLGSFVYSKKQFSDAIQLVELCDDSWVKNVRFDQVEDCLVSFLEGDFSCVKVALRPNV
ncbi:MAG: zinc-binding dehydrogenase [Pseudomonadota bacterium]